jgi:hypothetical protein
MNNVIFSDHWKPVIINPPRSLGSGTGGSVPNVTIDGGRTTISNSSINSINSVNSSSSSTTVNNGFSTIVSTSEGGQQEISLTNTWNSASGAQVGNAGNVNATINGNTFLLTAPGVVSVTCGTMAATLKFIGMSHVELTAGSVEDVVVSDGGTNTWIAGIGALTVTGGPGADNYVYHAGNARLTIKDFSAAQGDVLTIDKALQGSMNQVSDNAGGILLTFGAGGGIDVQGLTELPPSSIRWA